MKPTMKQTRWMSGLLVVALASAMVAPAAQADHRHVRRYKGWYPSYNTRVVTRYHNPGSVYVVRRSSAG